MAQETSSSPSERFCSPAQAKGLRLAIDGLVTDKGIADRFDTHQVDLPKDLLSDFPEPKPFEGESLNATKPTYRVIVTQACNVNRDLQHISDKPTGVAWLEIIRGQWVKLDEPDPVLGNKESAHALYEIALESNPDNDDPLYSVSKVIATYGSSLPLVDVPQPQNEELPQVVSGHEADAAIGWMAELLLTNNDLDMSQIS